jgi:LemA protein
MSTGLIIVLILVFIVVLCVGYFISVQRNIVSVDEFCQNAMSQISVQLNSRWDAVQALASMAARYASHESETIIAAIRERRGSGVASAGEAERQQEGLRDIVGRLAAVAEAYPDLKAEAVFRETMSGMRDFEEKVRVSRMVYNDTATKMNRMVRQWPSSFVASMLHFDVKDYLKVDSEEKKQYPNLDEAFKK